LAGINRFNCGRLDGSDYDHSSGRRIPNK